MPRILVVQHSTPEFLGTFEQAFEDRGIGFVYARPFMGDALPSVVGQYDALFLLGGGASPAERDKMPWLPEELRLAQGFRRARRPVVGIGLGALLVVQACAGRVLPDLAPHGCWCTARRTAAGENDSLAEAIDGQRVLVLHAGSVELPPGVPPLAVAEDGSWLVARPDPLMVALLLRPEMKPAMIEEMVMEGDRELPETIGAVLEEARERWEASQALALRVVGALVRSLDLMTDRPKRPIIPIRAVGRDDG